MIEEIPKQGIRLLIVLCSLATCVSCERNNLEKAISNCEIEISYADGIAPLMETHCAITDCHVGLVPIGDFTSYEELKKRVENSKLKLFVFDLKNMPPGNPLSEKDLKKISCWIEQGAPK
ncbi:MAG: hypothetical protein KA444_00665 [Bacteroidia bacterium]|nr:hypothetical protein [Bacteroidia bacterium]